MSEPGGEPRRPTSDIDEQPLDPLDPVEEARGLRGALRRHAVDTRPVRIADYRRLLIGQGTAFIGSMLTQVAVPVEIYAISHSSLLVGLVGFVGLLPIIVFGLYGGRSPMRSIAAGCTYGRRSEPGW